MSAADCYRFCLDDPHVHAVLGGPKSLAQLDENLAGLQKGPLTEEEQQDMVRQYAAQQAALAAQMKAAQNAAAAPQGDADVAGVALEGFDEADPTTWGNPGRNDSCPCGSGKKFKHCHGRLA